MTRKRRRRWRGGGRDWRWCSRSSSSTSCCRTHPPQPRASAAWAAATPCLLIMELQCYSIIWMIKDKMSLRTCRGIFQLSTTDFQEPALRKKGIRVCVHLCLCWWAWALRFVMWQVSVHIRVRFPTGKRHHLVITASLWPQTFCFHKFAWVSYNLKHCFQG